MVNIARKVISDQLSPGDKSIPVSAAWFAIDQFFKNDIFVYDNNVRLSVNFKTPEVFTLIPLLGENPGIEKSLENADKLAAEYFDYLKADGSSVAISNVKYGTFADMGSLNVVKSKAGNFSVKAGHKSSRKSAEEVLKLFIQAGMERSLTIPDSFVSFVPDTAGITVREIREYMIRARYVWEDYITY